MKTLNWILCYTLAFLFGLTLCSKDYNPFSDPENCDIHFISQSFTSSDTLNIFSTETVIILYTVPSFAESLTIEAKNNKYFGTKDNMVLKSPVSGQDTILFSFRDTGNVRITFHLKKTTGENVYKAINCYVKSPLKNSTITGGFDSSHPQTFKTGSVSDQDVIYQWTFFGRNKPIDLFNAETTGLFIDKINESGYGTVRIFDTIHSSPIDTFYYSFNDISPPQLEFLDDGLRNEDTLICSGESFYKIMKVTDPGCGIVQDVRINGHSEVDKDDIITKQFSSNMEEIEIFLRDASKNQNAVTLKYYVKKDTSRDVPDGNLKFKIIPEEDTIKVNTPFCKKFIQVEYYDKRTLNHRLNIFVNNHITDSIKLQNIQRSYYPFNMNLSKGLNSVTVELIDNEREKPVDTITVPIIYNEEYEVDRKPAILDVRFVNARISRGQVVLSSDSLELMVVAYVDNGKITAVFVKDDTLTCNNNGNEWSGSIHVFSKAMVTARDSITIIAIDSAGQTADTTFDIVKNAHPSMTVKNHKVHIVAGKVYSDMLLAVDEDGDKLTFGIVDSAGRSITLNPQTGEIRWKTTLSDTNKTGYLFQFSVTDNNDMFIDSVRVIVLRDSSDAILPQFTTKPSDIPSDIEVGQYYAYKLQFWQKPDSVYYLLKTDMNSIKIKNDTLILHPQINDTGYHRVTLVATNIVGESADTLNTLFLDFIVHKANTKPVINADSSLYKGNAPGIIMAGSIDSFMTFALWIDDPDIADRNLLKTGIKSSFSNAKIQLLPGVDNHYELLLFNNKNIAGEDTLLVFCEDHGGLVDTLKIPVHYSLKVYPAALLSPTEGEYVQSDTILFRWNRCKGNEDVNYLFQIGRSLDNAVQTVITKDTSLMQVVKKSDTYRWRVTTASGRDTAFGQWQYFSLHSSTHIQFSTVAGKIKNYCFADVDTYSLKLEIKEGTGSAKKEFKAVLIGNTKTINNITVAGNGVLTWIPTAKDTGTYVLTIQVVDSIGNADTLKTTFAVVPASGCHIDIKCSDTALYCDNAVDIYGEDSKTNLIVTIDRSRRSVFDTFNISVTSLGYSINVDADSAVMVLQRPLKVVNDDTLTITARNKSTNIASGTEKVIVRYNVPAKKMTIETGTISLNEGLSRIPVLIRLDKNSAVFTKKCGFRFLSNDKKDTLRYQINSWNQSNKTAEVWVLFDTIAPSGNTECRMEYGYQLPDRSNGKQVFDTLNHFGAVYHFEGLDAKGLVVKDESGAANDATYNKGDYTIIPAIGSAIYYNNITNQMNLQKKIVVGTTPQKTVVFESWVKMNFGTGTTKLFDIKISPVLQCYFVSEAGVLKLKYIYDELGNGSYKLGTVDKNLLIFVQNEWDRVGLMLSVQSDKVTYTVYLNGVMVADGALSSLPQSVIDNLSWTDGTSVLFSNVDSKECQYDEVWISKIRRYDDWYKFTWENQKEKSSLIKIEAVGF